MLDGVLANGERARVRAATNPVGNGVSTATERALRNESTELSSFSRFGLVALMPVFVPKEALMKVNRCRGAGEVPDTSSKGNLIIRPLRRETTLSSVRVTIAKIAKKTSQLYRFHNGRGSHLHVRSAEVPVVRRGEKRRERVSSHSRDGKYREVVFKVTFVAVDRGIGEKTSSSTIGKMIAPHFTGP